jgi:hypothetical protein
MIAGKDFEVKWEMAARMESVRMVFAVAAVQRLVVRQRDFVGAYINGKMDCSVYMKQPTGFVKLGEKQKVCLLLQPLYGLVQAGQIWYKLLADGYCNLGYNKNLADPCIRTRQRDGDLDPHGRHPGRVILGSRKPARHCRIRLEMGLEGS